jgi:hypothetical protein
MGTIQQVNSPTDQQLLRDYTERRPEAAWTSVDGPAMFAAWVTTEPAGCRNLFVSCPI